MERVSWKASNMEISPNCPRCGSSNTKFCYYNNYSHTQPRYFCKGCRRYWTKGGSLRNVPVGGGCRKNRRPLNNNNNNSTKPPPRPLLETDKDGGSSSSTTSSGGNSHIDLALVYANFLNQDSKNTGLDQIPAPELPGDFLLPNISNMHLDSTSGHGHQEHGLVAAAACFTPSGQLAPESQLVDVNPLAYFGELDSVLHHHHQEKNIHQEVLISSCNNNFGLPPFPGEEVGSHNHNHNNHDQECLWSASLSSSSSSMIHASHSSTSSTQLLGLEPDQADQIQDPNLVSGHVMSWSPFDLSTYDNFSRP